LQVRLDGRESGDIDSPNLIYEWTFAPGQLPSGFCPLVHRPCIESFCVGGTLFSDQTRPSAGLSFTGASNCAPTVFRPVYDTSTGFPYAAPAFAPDYVLAQNPPMAGRVLGHVRTGTGNICPRPGTLPCRYRAIAPTNTFIGDSAYFTPTTKGTYRARLTVSDGCSSSVSEVRYNTF
jgi:hypothetical protein